MNFESIKELTRFTVGLAQVVEAFRDPHQGVGGPAALGVGAGQVLVFLDRLGIELLVHELPADGLEALLDLVLGERWFLLF